MTYSVGLEECSRAPASFGYVHAEAPPVVLLADRPVVDFISRAVVRQRPLNLHTYSRFSAVVNTASTARRLAVRNISSQFFSFFRSDSQVSITLLPDTVLPQRKSRLIKYRFSVPGGSEAGQVSDVGCLGRSRLINGSCGTLPVVPQRVEQRDQRLVVSRGVALAGGPRPN